jgi:ribosome biogenesis protein NSA1
MALSEGEDGLPLIALGGRERELGLWDVGRGEATWAARNVPHDMLDLRQPVWVTAARFMSSPHVLAVGTAYKQLRVYDVRADRRPVRQMDLKGHRVMAITGVWVGGCIRVVCGL